MSTVPYTHDSNSIQEFVFSEIQSIGPEVGSVSPESTLESLGLDSLDVVELSQSVKKNLGIAVNVNDFIGAVTVSDVLALVCERAGIV